MFLFKVEMLKFSIQFSLIHVQLTYLVFFSRVNTKGKNNGWFKLKEYLNTTQKNQRNFKGTGIFDLKRTEIYAHTFAWSEVIDKIEFWSCLYCVESVCITCGSEQDTIYKIIYAKMCIWCKTMRLIPHSLLAIFHV